MTVIAYASTKTYEHSVGLSACFRQHRAKHSHCSFLHGYALQVKVEFRAQTLDDRNWVVDFGSLKLFKKWLQDTFDHKTLVANDDPQIEIFRQMNNAGLIQLYMVKDTGCEAFAELIFNHLCINDERYYDYLRVWIHSVEVREHGGNSAIIYGRSLPNHKDHA